LRVLARSKWLRGSRLDPFGRSADRRLERELLARYEECLDRIADELDDARFELALELLRLPGQVRGYGPIKSAAAARARTRELELLQQWAAPVVRASEPRASAA
jgi:indolepyruvate ferredoxin oxidoreductase